MRGAVEGYRSTEYPPQKVLVFDIDDPYLPAHWLTKAVLNFRERQNMTPQMITRETPALAGADHDQLLEAYMRIWQSGSYSSYQPSVDLVELGALVSETLPDGLIERV